MIDTNVTLRLCLALFSVYLFITGILFILGPIVFDIDYIFESNLILVTVYLLVVAKLFATFWIILTSINIKLLKYKHLSNIAVWIAIIFSLTHLIFVFIQNIFGNNINDLFEMMAGDSIKIVLLMLLYLYITRKIFKNTYPN